MESNLQYVDLDRDRIQQAMQVSCSFAIYWTTIVTTTVLKRNSYVC